MVVTFFGAPLIRVESALAGRATELRLAVLAHKRSSFLPLEIVQGMLFELLCAELFVALRARMFVIVAWREAFR